MGLLDPFRKGLEKTRKLLGAGFVRLSAAMGRFDEEWLQELEDSFIAADAGMTATLRLTDAVRSAIRRTGDVSRTAVARVLADEMRAILGPPAPLALEKGRPTILLLVGVNGTGKTTTTGKLAARYRTDGFRVVIGAADTFRAAAIEQLEIWAQRADTPLIASHTGADPAAVVFDTLQAARARKADLVLLDTAGRLHNKQHLMDELAKIRRVIQREAPDARCDTLLVIDATTGQNAVSQARQFHEAVRVDGLVLTKLDGNAKGGVALAVAVETGLPIRLAGLGERLEDLVDFDPDAFIQSLLPEA